MSVRENFMELLASKNADFQDPRTRKYINAIHKYHARYMMLRPGDLRIDQGKFARRKAEKVLAAALVDPLVSLGAKDYIACMAVDIRPATAWALQRFSGTVLHSVIVLRYIKADEELLAALMGRQSLDLLLDQETCTIALRSTDFLQNVTIEKEGIAIPANSYFVESFSDTLFKVMTTTLFTEYERMGLTLSEIASRARKVYNLDENLPDEWVAKVFV